MVARLLSKKVKLSQVDLEKAFEFAYYQLIDSCDFEVYFQTCRALVVKSGPAVSRERIMKPTLMDFLSAQYQGYLETVGSHPFLYESSEEVWRANSLKDSKRKCLRF